MKSCRLSSLSGRGAALIINKEPLVSVIMPVYNAQVFIAQAIESVKKQTYKKWELLIVDDASVDDSCNIVKKFTEDDERIKLFILKGNSGTPAVPRNFGIRQSRGKYIAFLDADDLWIPDKIRKQAAFMEENRDVYLCYSKYYIQKDGVILKELRPKDKHLRSGMIFNQLFLSSNFIPCLTVMIRSDCKIENYFFDENKNLRAVEDFDLWLKIARDKKVAFINEPLSIYREHAKNISKRKGLFVRNHWRIIRKWHRQPPLLILFKKYLSFFCFFCFRALNRVALFFRNG